MLPGRIPQNSSDDPDLYRRPGAGILFFEKLLSFLAKSQNASVIFVPASRSSHTFGHKNHSVFRFLSRTANVFLQKMDALLPEAKQKRWSSELLRFRRHPYFLLVFIFFRGILIKKAAVPGQAAADSDKNHYDDFRDDACKYKVTIS